MREPSHTKRGPGRRHAQGKGEAREPRPQRVSAGRNWTSRPDDSRRSLVRLLGIRQFKRWMRALSGSTTPATA